MHGDVARGAPTSWPTDCVPSSSHSRSGRFGPSLGVAPPFLAPALGQGVTFERLCVTWATSELCKRSRAPCRPQLAYGKQCGTHPHDTWVSGSDVNSFCCYGLVKPSGFLVVLEKPTRSSCTCTFTRTCKLRVKGSDLACEREHRTRTGPCSHHAAKLLSNSGCTAVTCSRTEHRAMSHADRRFD